MKPSLPQRLVLAGILIAAAGYGLWQAAGYVWRLVG